MKELELAHDPVTSSCNNTPIIVQFKKNLMQKEGMVITWRSN